MICTNMKKILSHQVDLGPSMLDVKYKELGGSGLVTTPLNMAPNLSECNVSHAGIAQSVNHCANRQKHKIYVYALIKTETMCFAFE